MGLLWDIEQMVDEEGYDMSIKRLWTGGGDCWSVKMTDTDTAKTSWKACGKTLKKTLRRVLRAWSDG